MFTQFSVILTNGFQRWGVCKFILYNVWTFNPHCEHTWVIPTFHTSFKLSNKAVFFIYFLFIPTRKIKPHGCPHPTLCNFDLHYLRKFHTVFRLKVFRRFFLKIFPFLSLCKVQLQWRPLIITWRKNISNFIEDVFTYILAYFDQIVFEKILQDFSLIIPLMKFR